MHTHMVMEGVKATVEAGRRHHGQHSSTHRVSGKAGLLRRHELGVQDLLSERRARSHHRWGGGLARESLVEINCIAAVVRDVKKGRRTMAFNDRWNAEHFWARSARWWGRFFSGRKALHYHLPRVAKPLPSPASVQPETLRRIGRNHGHQRAGHMTVLGGSLMRPEVEAVMALAGRHFVSVPELEVAAGKRIAEMLKLPEDTAPSSLRGRRRDAVGARGHPNG